MITEVAAVAAIVLSGGTPPPVPATLPVQQIVFTVQSLDGAVSNTDDRRFTLASDVLFAFDKADLTPRARTELARIAKLLAEPGKKPVTTVKIGGYTSSEGSDGYNQKLSERRAAAVQQELAPLLDGGIRVTATGYGETHPVADNATKKGKAKNRRVEIDAA